MAGFAPTPVMDRILPRLTWQGDCLIFEGARSLAGYGVVRERLDGKRTQSGVHRVVYRETIGEIPDGQYVCHSCDNPPCCNPDHLWVGPPKANTDDMVEKGRARGGMTGSQTCRRGHLFTGESTYIYPSGRRSCRTCRKERR